ncbi:hypothetical protein GUJ93_ZPchr0001g30207 [Zizania palustris]|uniref:Uncharacterized protein n=1 Tax=Zizania palustris TaxID=103762 RepID=A0A8J5VM56_ZIZPA|nr:hypothetical protein GUJ93_ZPchr0001g30207 [Zizania palustris]
MTRRTFKWAVTPVDTPNQGWPWLDSTLTLHRLGPASACVRASAWGCVVAPLATPGRVAVGFVLVGACGRASGRARACGCASTHSALVGPTHPAGFARSVSSACAVGSLRMRASPLHLSARIHRFLRPQSSIQYSLLSLHQSRALLNHHVADCARLGWSAGLSPHHPRRQQPHQH